MPFSPRQQFAGQAVLVTGGLGYLGSIVVEQLLRLTEVDKLYLLVRGKRHWTAQQRVDELLCGPLFNMLHSDAANGRRNVFHKVQAIEGDLTEPGLGLSDADAQLLKDQVVIILHCGASIELDADVQKTLTNNYMGTLNLMRVASEFTKLRSFVHTSTYFVNNHLPRNSIVKEQIYQIPLSVGGISMTHTEYVAAMLAMEPEQANKHTLELMQRLDFTSTYAFGKHLTEQLVDATAIRPGVSRAIVRPSLIASIAGDPYPGYINSYAGAGGYTMGYALGFFQGVKSVAYGSDTFLDLIPADTVASLVIAAAAAASATSGSPSADGGAVIFHAASSQSYPLTISMAFDRMGIFWKANPPPLCLPASRYVKIKGEHIPTAKGIQAGSNRAKLKIKLLGGMLKMMGKHREVRALKVGFKAFSVHNSLGYAKSIVCSVDNVRALQLQMAPKERRDFKVLWEESSMGWDHYGFTFQAGVRRLLFRMDQPVHKLPHSFVYRSKADATMIQHSGSRAADITAGTAAAAAAAAACLEATAASSDGDSAGRSEDCRGSMDSVTGAIDDAQHANSSSDGGSQQHQQLPSEDLAAAAETAAHLLQAVHLHQELQSHNSCTADSNLPGGLAAVQSLAAAQ